MSPSVPPPSHHTVPATTGTRHTPGAEAGPPGAGARAHRRRLRVEDVTVVDHALMRTAVRGTIVGNTMEWYDVGVHGYLAVIMGQVFLPTAASSVQVLFSLGVFASTYIARPLGGIVLGRLGDRIGRQRVLAATLILMAASTFCIGLLPTHATIGTAAPVLLVALKLLQGFSTGGEYAGATTFVSEHSPDRRRGFFASILDTGSYLGFALGAVVVSALHLTLGEQAIIDGAWRIPFLLAGPLGAVAIHFRLRIEETPAFQAQLDAQQAAGAGDGSRLHGAPGTLRMVRTLWRPILISMTLVAAANTLAYALTSYSRPTSPSPWAMTPCTGRC